MLVARDKAENAFKALKRPILIEDTSLFYDAMSKNTKDGLPGVYIKWFFKALGDEGLSKILDGFESKKATALSTCIYIESLEKEPIISQTEVRCEITRPRPPLDTGAWNSIVIPEGESQTWSEMEIDHRHATFHRTINYIKVLKMIEEAAPNTKIKTG